MMKEEVMRETGLSEAHKVHSSQHLTQTAITARDNHRQLPRHKNRRVVWANTIVYVCPGWRAGSLRTSNHVVRCPNDLVNKSLTHKEKR